jgi:hypothetical protein
MNSLALWARDAAGSIDQGHRYRPQGYMAKTSFRERITVITGTVTHPATGMVAKIRNKSNNQFGTRLIEGFDAKPLHLKSLADKLFNKHGFLPQIDMVVGASITT